MKLDRTQLLEKRIAELEQELRERERDLAIFRSELENANSKLESFLAHFSRELKVMSQIQKTLVPTEFPNIKGLEFSTKFVPGRVHGGDYFDIFEHENKFRFSIVVAHSSGYSMSALLLSVLLKLTGQIEARRGTPPEQVMKSLLREIKPHMQEQDTAQVFYGVVDRRKYELHYTSLGNTVGLHYISATGELKRLSRIDQPIARDFNSPLAAHSLLLNPRDRLILCTEGLFKVQNAAGESFGDELLYRTVLEARRLTVHELRNEILYQASLFASPDGEFQPDQDIAVVVLEVKDRVIKLAKEQ